LTSERRLRVLYVDGVDVADSRASVGIAGEIGTATSVAVVTVGRVERALERATLDTIADDGIGACASQRSVGDCSGTVKWGNGESVPSVVVVVV
jgi:hypothetical protein